MENLVVCFSQDNLGSKESAGLAKESAGFLREAWVGMKGGVPGKIHLLSTMSQNHVFFVIILRCG